MDNTFSPLPVAELGAILLGNMSPASILRYSHHDRETIAEARNVIAAAAAERVEKLELELQNAKRAHRHAEEAAYTADAIASAPTDLLHERQPGDVILAIEGAQEFTVLGIRPGTRGASTEYLVVPTAHANDAEGDGPRPVWHPHYNFRRP